ncbi:hypothetical protein VNO77_16632 [Canavalia gladiata]|uniref:Uncharacterized protein n=1 Tax=Canavalia gladiata TaxID=3824 RepID=A0AAN9LI54_CANGL
MLVSPKEIMKATFGDPENFDCANTLSVTVHGLWCMELEVYKASDSPTTTASFRNVVLLREVRREELLRRNYRKVWEYYVSHDPDQSPHDT